MPIEFWFEFGSTYTYPAALRIEKLAQMKSIEIAWKPFLLGPIFNAQGWKDSPFNLYPTKGQYMWRDLERLCQKYALPFKKPSQFPRNGLLAARISLVAAQEPWLPDFVRAVYTGNFAEDRDISDVGFLQEILESLNQPAERLIQKAHSPENKAHLRTQTEQAMQFGIFGAPTFVVDQELFWGNDRLEDALEWHSSKN